MTVSFILEIFFMGRIPTKACRFVEKKQNVSFARSSIAFNNKIDASLCINMLVFQIAEFGNLFISLDGNGLIIIH